MTGHVDNLYSGGAVFSRVQLALPEWPFRSLKINGKHIVDGTAQWKPLESPVVSRLPQAILVVAPHEHGQFGTLEFPGAYYWDTPLTEVFQWITATLDVPLSALHVEHKGRMLQPGSSIPHPGRPYAYLYVDLPKPERAGGRPNSGVRTRDRSPHGWRTSRPLPRQYM